MALTKYPKSLQKSSVVSKTANYTAVETDDIILCNSSGGAFTITLPAAATYNGKILTLKKTDSTFATANAITIDGNASETIDGALTTTLNTQYETLEIISDGSNWHVVQRLIPSVWTSFTPTGAFTTNTTYTGFWRRNRDSIDIRVMLSFSGATNATTNATFNLVSGLTIDTAKIMSTTDTLMSFNSTGKYLDSGVSFNEIYAAYLSTTSFRINTNISASAGSTDTNTAVGTNSNLPAIPASGDLLEVEVYGVPITGWNG